VRSLTVPIVATVRRSGPDRDAEPGAENAAELDE
jgi:hypothetical protein